MLWVRGVCCVKLSGMLAKVFGGPLVQLLEHHQNTLVFRAKRAPKLDKEIPLRVSGIHNKPAKIKAVVTSCRPLEPDGFVCTATVKQPSHQRELGRLGLFSVTSHSGLRQSKRIPRRIDIVSGQFRGTSVDISSGGIQVQTSAVLVAGQILTLNLMPGLACGAKVAWVSEGRAGLEFCEVDDATKLLLDHFASGRAMPTVKKSDTEKKERKVFAPPSYESL